MYMEFRTGEADAVMMTGHNAAAIVALRFCSRIRRLLCQHYHHTGVKSRSEWRLIYALAADVFANITFPTAFVRDEAIDLYPAVAKQSLVLRNPFVLGKLRSKEDQINARARFGLPLSQPIIGNAGWLIERKRFDIFVRTAKLVLAAIPNAIFVIAGDGPEKGRLQDLCRTEGVDGAIRFLGWVRDTEDFYRCLDVVLFNTDWDALGRTPLEAVSQGVPVVCSVLNGGLSEYVGGGVGGFLFKRHDVEELAEAVLSLLSQPKEALAMVVAGREFLRQVADPDRDLASVESLLGVRV